MSSIESRNPFTSIAAAFLSFGGLGATTSGMDVASLGLGGDFFELVLDEAFLGVGTGA
jgi:hypothetical protein